MSRLIDLDEIDPDGIFLMTKADFLISLYKSPVVDAIPVVRCKDCKYSVSVYDLIGVIQNDLVYCKSSSCIKKIDFFCADGERRKNEDR